MRDRHKVLYGGTERQRGAGAGLFPLLPRLSPDHMRALRCSVQQLRRAYRDQGFGETAGAQHWIGLAEQALRILEEARRDVRQDDVLDRVVAR